MFSYNVGHALAYDTNGLLTCGDPKNNVEKRRRLRLFSLFVSSGCGDGGVG